MPRWRQIFIFSNRYCWEHRELIVSGVKYDQLKKFREADWAFIKGQLVRYAEQKVRRKSWHSGGFLPKGHEAPDLVALAIAKTLNAILGEKEDIATWNEDNNPLLIDHLKDAIDTEVGNLVRSEEHRVTNYSPSVDLEQAREIFEASVDSAQLLNNVEVRALEHELFEDFRDKILGRLDGDAQKLFLVYCDLSHTHDVVKPSDAAIKMGTDVNEVYNLIKKLRRAADQVKKELEVEYAR